MAKTYGGGIFDLGETFVGTTNLSEEFFPMAWGPALGEKIMGVVLTRQACVHVVTLTKDEPRKLRRWRFDGGFRIVEREAPYDPPKLA